MKDVLRSIPEDDTRMLAVVGAREYSGLWTLEKARGQILP